MKLKKLRKKIKILESGLWSNQSPIELCYFTDEGGMLRNVFKEILFTFENHKLLKKRINRKLKLNEKYLNNKTLKNGK